MSELPQAQFRSYLAVTWLATLAVLACVAAINLVADPANLFRPDAYELGIAKIMADGQNVIGLSNYDERHVQRDYLAVVKRLPDRIILGSSRVMLVQGGPKGVFNHGVSGGSIEDDLAIYELYLEKQHTPSTVWLGLDPWIFNRNNDQTRWQSLGEEYERMAARLGLPPRGDVPRQSRYFELFSLAYLEASLQQLQSGQRGNPYHASRSDISDEFVKRSDGSIRYDRAYRSRTPAEVARLAFAEAHSGRIYSLENFERLDPLARASVRALVATIQARHARLVIYLPPYHPLVYSVLASDPRYARVPEAERWIRALAAEAHVEVRGSYDPVRAGCNDTQFYDAMHANEAGVAHALGPL